jgi:hypothetical protein
MQEICLKNKNDISYHISKSIVTSVTVENTGLEGN